MGLIKNFLTKEVRQTLNNAGIENGEVSDGYLKETFTTLRSYLKTYYTDGKHTKEKDLIWGLVFLSKLNYADEDYTNYFGDKGLAVSLMVENALEYKTVTENKTTIGEMLVNAKTNQQLASVVSDLKDVSNDVKDVEIVLDKLSGKKSAKKTKAKKVKKQKSKKVKVSEEAPAMLGNSKPEYEKVSVVVVVSFESMQNPVPQPFGMLKDGEGVIYFKAGKVLKAKTITKLIKNQMIPNIKAKLKETGETEVDLGKFSVDGIYVRTNQLNSILLKLNK